MASHQDFVDYVAEQLRAAGMIRSRKMFGEYGLYCDGVFFAVICDDQFFVKITPQGEAAFPDLPRAPAYEGARAVSYTHLLRTALPGRLPASMGSHLPHCEKAEARFVLLLRFDSK